MSNTSQSVTVHATVSYICILLLGNQHVDLGRGQLCNAV